MKKTFRYGIFGLGCILGTLVGIGLLHRYGGEIRQIADKIQNLFQINDDLDDRVAGRAKASAAALPGDSTTDAPPPELA